MGHKKYNLSHIVFIFPLFNYVKKTLKFTTHKWPFYDLFWPVELTGQIFVNLIYKTEVQTVILMFLVCPNDNWIKINNTIYFFMPENYSIVYYTVLKMHHFMASLLKWVLTKKFSHFQNGYFSKILWTFMTHTIR